MSELKIGLISISSWFWFHNETLNIWTHLLGFFYFFYHLVYHLYAPPSHMVSRWELLPIVVQLICYQVRGSPNRVAKK